MKTAEEWLIELTGYSPAVGGNFVLNPEEIKQIQLDAWKQGMKDAIDILDRRRSINLLNVIASLQKAHDNKTSI